MSNSPSTLPDWAAAWQPMIDAVGQDFAPGLSPPDADPIERGTVRRYLEPLEFDCPLHYDPEVARAYGHDDVVLPCTALMTFALAPAWRPGETIFTSAERDAQPARSAVTGVRSPLEPPTTGFFATEYEVEYLRPAVAGDRLARRGAKLVACTPKETKVGRGAFLTWETDIVNQRGEVVAHMRSSFFRYNPHPGAAS
ncbi:FAS1-like dehydratase domain-containing protein [Azospirillum sp.]|uniref:FAS1-like dehydratase domain-containing protein n=1 Tax=Azospirillum sp. TaxID=34012 RepID=UPI002D303205|nr:MaoC family dehydratase N-terminal domain-containing protein [Azospirillum sp.]HYD69147.1 MaoC family dehydratase N-terminal domain-containing protein [Azospirillum sp.]